MLDGVAAFVGGGPDIGTVARPGVILAGTDRVAVDAVAVALALALSLRWQRPRWPRLITNELHSYVTLLALVFIGVHGLAVWVDPFRSPTSAGATCSCPWRRGTARCGWQPGSSASTSCWPSGSARSCGRASATRGGGGCTR